jgi:dihydrodipicolinate synthase/N-acetylneuraminate lyase
MSGRGLGLRGVIATPVTAFTTDDRVDRATMVKLIGFLLDSGVQALALPMHIGESLNMSLDERKELAEIAIGAVAGAIPVLVNASLPGTGQVVELARHAEKAGADGVIVISPYHWAPGPDALVEHFVTVGSSIDVALFAYNFPRKVGVSLTPAILERLFARLDNLVGMKDATYDMELFTELCRRTAIARPGFSVFAGVEYILPAMILGGAGSFSACGAVAPVLVRRLYDACASGRWEDARALQYRVSALWQVLHAGYPASVKMAMELLGRPAGRPRPPLTTLSEVERAHLRAELDKLGVFAEEPIGWRVLQPQTA